MDLVRRSVFVLSPPKTATQSVYRSLRIHPGLAVEHAHGLDRIETLLSQGPNKNLPAGDADVQWRYKISKEYRLLRSLLDVRSKKTIVVIRRDPDSRLCSELFYAHSRVIVPLYDWAHDRFDLVALDKALRKTATRAEALMQDYAERAYAPLGIDAALVGAGYSETCVRADLELVVLRFEFLATDFARLVERLDLPATPLMHVNPGRDRARDSGRTGRFDGAVGQDERRLYAAFVRDFMHVYRSDALRAVA